MTVEIGLVLDWTGQELHWHEPPGRSAGHIPDSHDLWEFLFENRGVISGFAHSHPGSGAVGPSYEDVTTFAAVEAGLGLRLDWWILNADSMVLVRWAGPDRLDYSVTPVAPVPMWADYLRRRSGMEPWEPPRVRAARSEALGKLLGDLPGADTVEGDQT